MCEKIREWENEFNECKRTKTTTQIMAPLLQVRLHFTFLAFDQTALDYSGQFNTIQGHCRSHMKRWLYVFTCLSTQVVHLEIAWGLDTDSFLNAFNRFTSWRVVLKEKKMTSDNPPRCTKLSWRSLYMQCWVTVKSRMKRSGVESLLYSRPLMYQLADPRDDIPLTSNHFLFRQMGGQFAPENVNTTRFYPRKRWRKVQVLISPVWFRWQKED